MGERTLRRYQVRMPQKPWDVPGPDLLRTRASAVVQVTELLPRAGRLAVRKRRGPGAWSDWRVAVRAELLEELPSLLVSLDGGQLLQLAAPSGSPIDVAVRAEEVKVVDLPGATARAEVCSALVHHRFPSVRHAGAFACKQYGSVPGAPVIGGRGWSMHAWGDATDETENPAAGVANDDVTDWSVRMAREDLMPAVQVIGSLAGAEVVAAPPGWRLGPYDDTPAVGTHLWHVHITCAWHTGVPPCAGGNR